jgi:pilus assembly protein Flp/PilA
MPVHTANPVRRFVREEDGASAVEYALLVACVGIVFVAGARLLGGNINTRFTGVATTVAAGQ